MGSTLIRRMLVVFIVCALAFLAGCAPSAVRKPTPTATPRAATTASMVPCAATPPASLDVSSGSRTITPSTVVSYQEAGYCELLFIFAGPFGISYHGHASAVLAVTYVEVMNGAQRNVTIYTFLDSGKTFVVEPATEQCGNSAVPVQPLFVSVFYPGNGALTPHLLPTTMSGNGLTEGLFPEFGLPMPRDGSLTSALCAPSTGS